MRSTHGSRAKDPWKSLIGGHGWVQTLVNRLTESFRQNFNVGGNVSLRPLLDCETGSYRFLLRLLCKLNTRKAAGLDRIPSLLSKIETNVFYAPFVNIFNASI